MVSPVGGGSAVDEAIFRLVADTRGFITSVQSAGQQAAGQLRQVDAAAEKNVSTVGKIGSQFTRMVGLAAAAAAAFAAVKFGTGAEQYEATLSRIWALTSLTTDEVNRMGREIVEMAPEMGKGPNELAEGFYFAASTIDDADKALAVLTASAKASSVGLGDTKTVVDALTSAMNAYNLGADDAARVTDILLNTVKYGKMEPADLAQSLGRVLPVASALKLELEDLGASLAVLSNVGLSTEEAVTAVRQVLVTLIKPTKQANDLLKSVGLDVGDLRDSLGTTGLLPTLNMIIDATEGNVDALSEIFPNIRALIGVLGTAGVQGERYGEILEGIRNGMGATDIAFEHHTHTLEYAQQRLRATIEAGAYKILLTTLPAISAALSDTTHAFETLEPALSPVGSSLKVIADVLNALKPILVILTALWAAHRIQMLLVASATWQAAAANMAMLTGGPSRALASATMGLAAGTVALATSWVGVAIAIGATDIALRKMTGSGLLSWLTGAAQAQRRYAESLRETGDAQQRMNDLVKEGMTAQQAQTKEFERLAARAKEVVERNLPPSGPFIPSPTFDIKEPLFGLLRTRRSEAQKEAVSDLKALHEQVMKLNPSYQQLRDFTAGSDAMTKLFADDLDRLKEAFDAVALQQEVDHIKDMADAMRDAAEGTVELVDAAKTLKEQYSALDAAISLAGDTLKGQEATTLAYLKLQQSNLERQKNLAPVGTWTSDQEKQLQATSKAIENVTAQLETGKNALALYGYSMVTYLGGNLVDSANKVTELGDRFSQLPPEIITLIKAVLPEMQMAQMYLFMEALRRGATFNVAIKVSSAGTESNLKAWAESWDRMSSRQQAYVKGKLAITGPNDPTIQELYDLSQAVNAFDESVNALLPTVTGSGAAAAKGMSEAEKGLRALQAAFKASGMTALEWAFVMKIVQQAAKDFNLSGEQMVEILRLSGLSAMEFAQRLWALTVLEQVKRDATEAADAVDGLYDAFSKLYGQPTREEAALKLTLADLKLRREESLQYAGANKGSVAAYVRELDKQIAQIEDDLELRRLHQDVARAELDVSNQVLLNDQQQLTVTGWLITAMGGASASAAALGTTAFASSIRLQQWTRDLGNWMEAIGATRPEGFQGGGIIPGPRGAPILILAHGQEVMLTPDQYAELRGGYGFNMPISITAQGADFDMIRRAAHEAVEAALQGSRARWYRAGASLSGSIG